LLGFC
jgi:hypothetical protein